MRRYLDMAGLWRFQPDVYAEGEALGYSAVDCDVRQWREVRVPCRMDTCINGMEAYEGAGWFRKSFRVPDEWRGLRIAIRFEGVNYTAGVWVNGEPVGRHEDGFLPFEFRIDGHIRFGQENVLVVRADNTRRAGEVPGLERGWRPFGGILREATLIATPPIYIERAWMASAEMDGRFCCKVRISEREGQCSLEIRDPAGQVCGSLPARAEGGEARFAGSVANPQLWSPDSPVLYTAKVTLGEDERQFRFGFRSIRANGDRLLLNGKPVYLTGFNRHEDSPRTDMGTDLATVRADLLDMKKLGSNFVRLCHYPHHPGELDMCDEIGLLAMGEIPLYWWHGHEIGREDSDKTLAVAKRQLTALIERDISHPSIIFWSVSNETHENLSEVVAGNAELCNLAQQLDPTRLAVHVARERYWKHCPAFDADDVVCITGYPTIWGGHRDNPKRDPARSPELWRSNLAALHEKYPGKPILIAEFGHPALEGVVGNPHGQDMQARALEGEFAALSAPYVCGATIWCYAHHPWPEDNFINYITTSPFGVVTRERRRLPAWAVVQRMFHERHGKPVPVEPPRPRPTPGDISVRMVRPHMRDIPQAVMPEGYSIRAMRRTDGALWTDVQRDAEPIIRIGDDLFWREFGDDRAAIEWRCFLIHDARGLAVGTISAWYSRDFRGQDWGRIHWVATRPAHRGKGIARAGLTHAMNCLAQWHERAWLVTSSTRLPAIRIYLDYGFVPDIENEGDEETWRDIMREITTTKTRRHEEIQ